MIVTRMRCTHYFLGDLHHEGSRARKKSLSVCKSYALSTYYLGQDEKIRFFLVTPLVQKAHSPSYPYLSITTMMMPPRQPWCRMLVITSLAMLVLVESVRAQTTVTNGQLQKCNDAMFRVDVDNDGKVNRAEYINMLMDISPYRSYARFGVIASDSCPDIGSIQDFLGDAPLSAVFEEFACRCLEHEEEGPDCCKGQQNKHLKVPGVYSVDYTVEMCTAIIETIVGECTTMAPTISPAPSLAPTAPPSSAPTVSSAPSAISSTAPSSSAAPSSVPTLVPTTNIIEKPELTKEEDGNNPRNTNNGDDGDDKDDIIKIVVPVALGFFLLALLGLFLVHRNQQSKMKNGNFRSFENADRDSLDQDNLVDDQDDMILFSYDKDSEGYGNLKESADPTTERDSSVSNSDSHFVFMDPLTNSDGDEEQGVRSNPAAATAATTATTKTKTKPLSDESKPAPFDSRHHKLDLALDLDQDHQFNDSDDKSLESGNYHQKSVGSLTWSGGEDDSHDSNSSSSVDAANPEESLSKSFEKSYTSADQKGGELDSREVAINAIIEQTKAGAEWFEFELPSSESDESSVGHHDDADADDENTNSGSYRLEKGLDPEDAKALEAILSENSASL
jgi:hypothetical protein